ncbi:hypothetical protein QEH52_01495 [Coraliomargarita sp. SDUM461003]|uniref:Uncharacterized protein n=1 Tax=Thalassobacterium maritimum TaxID=3041265 RepID=A0ABU1ASP7_9BACT|nr:hypothetical protein [Coraliomargarita sp. SDUM461003]MDQ8206165.1 hypothetical protein [Coraliomargarita sp. SDUM461003]
MTDPANDYVGELTQIFINLGAAEDSAEVMARQLLKRAGQIAEERGISKVEATETLLKQVFEARQQA